MGSGEGRLRLNAGRTVLSTLESFAYSQRTSASRGVSWGWAAYGLSLSAPVSKGFWLELFMAMVGRCHLHPGHRRVTA